MLLLQKIALFAHFLCQIQRQCAIGWSLVPQPPLAAVLTASTRGLRDKWGFCTVAGTWWLTGLACSTPWLAPPACREGEASAAALPGSGLFLAGGVFPFPFVSQQMFEMLCQSVQCCGSLCFTPPSIWVHQAWVSWSCPCRAGWGWGTRGSSRRPLRSTRSHPCPRGSTWLPACRSSHLGEEKWSELMEAMYMTGFLH